MVVHNPNNWHWIDKNCLPWSKEYFDENIKNTVVDKDGFKYTITTVESITGDCDVTQRKGKVLCIYDMSLSLGVSVEEVKEQSEDESNVTSGTISLAEFVHDQDDDEYVFEIKSDEKRTEIKKHLIPVLKSKLQKFQPDLIEAHSKDVQHASN
ncbi:putative hsp90 regulator [Scheffersomyces coipomensis]|uniref:putative hsp90 regulator n=1 Tax=Scheffersomyces coipomensis TaxID=1788519 RepID=UPI00315D12F1